MPLEFVESSKGKPLLVLDGYLFRKDKNTLTGISWRCIKKSCKARVVTENEACGESVEHSHAPDGLSLEVRKSLNELRGAAKSFPLEVKPSTVVGSMIAKVGSEAVKGRLPNMALLRKQVTFARQKLGAAAVKRPRSREEIQLPEVLKKTLANEAFLHFDSGEGKADRMMVFATERNMALLRERPEWFLDGTFKVCPSLFYQLYSVLVKLHDGNVVPVMYALLPSKTAEHYRSFVQILTDAVDGFDPQGLHVDFEVPMIKELERAFPAAGIIGCGFHFNQCLWRKIQRDEPLRTKYGASVDFALGLRMFAALAYIPLDDVRMAFDVLVESKFVREHSELLKSFINYFESTWVGRVRNPPVMKREWWNLFAAALSGMSRSSNEIEGWHSAFSARVGGHHPNIFRLIEFLKMEQARTEFVLSNTLSQGRASAQRGKYRDRQTRLQRLASAYKEYDTLEYLTGVAHNLGF